MNIRELKYFLEVAEQGSFSKASETIHLSQPTLSKVVKDLEEELGALLFNRTTRKIELTDVGKVVQLHAKTVLQEINNLRVAVADLQQLRTGSFSLGLPPVIGSSFFPKNIMEFRKLHPNITIQLVEEGSKRIAQLLLEGTIDLGVVVLPVDEELFEVVPIVERQLKLVLPIDHPLANEEKVYLNDLRHESFILFRQEFSLHDRVKEACVREGFEPNVAYESSQWDFIYELICAGQGISLLPETICQKFDANKVRLMNAVEPQIHWNLGVIWKRDGYLSHATREWIEYTKQMFR